MFFGDFYPYLHFWAQYLKKGHHEIVQMVKLHIVCKFEGIWMISSKVIAIIPKMPILRKWQFKWILWNLHLQIRFYKFLLININFRNELEHKFA